MCRSKCVPHFKGVLIHTVTSDMAYASFVYKQFAITLYTVLYHCALRIQKYISVYTIIYMYVYNVTSF